MMTFALFFAAVVKSCPGRYCSATVDMSYHPLTPDVLEPNWKAYDSHHGWTNEHKTPEGALAQLRELQTTPRPEPVVPPGAEAVDPIMTAIGVTERHADLEKVF